MHKIIISILLFCNVAVSQFATTTRQQQYQKESYTVFGAMTTLYNGDRKRIMDSLVFRLKRDTIWSTRDVIYIFANLDSNQAKINWKTPGTFNITTVATVTFTADQGYAGNGSTGYMKTGYIPFDTASHFGKINDMQADIYNRSTTQQNVYDFGALSNSNHSFALDIKDAGNIYMLVNDGTFSAIGNANAQGFYSMNRTAYNTRTLYRNGSSVGTQTVNSLPAPPNVEIFIHSRNNAGAPNLFSTKQFSFFSVGSSLSATKISSFNTDVEWYMDRLGTGVQ